MLKPAAWFCLRFPVFSEKRLVPTRGRSFSSGATQETITVVELEEEERRRDAGLTKGERWRDRRGVRRWLTLTLLPASPAASWVFILWRRPRSPPYISPCAHMCTHSTGGTRIDRCVLFIFLFFLSFFPSFILDCCISFKSFTHTDLDGSSRLRL